MTAAPLPELEPARTALIDAGRRLAATGLVRGSSGNLAVRVGDHLLITPTGGRLSALSREEIAVLDATGTQVGGTLAPSSELGLHRRLVERPDVGAVVHAHPPAATAVGLLCDELPLVHYEMMALGGPVRVAPYVRYGTPALAEAVAGAIDGRRAALMANHGAVTTGADLTAAVEATELLEWLCELWLRASAIGTPRTLTAREGAEFAASGYRSLPTSATEPPDGPA